MAEVVCLARRYGLYGLLLVRKTGQDVLIVWAQRMQDVELGALNTSQIDASAQLPSHLPIQPPLKWPRSVLQNLNLGLDIQHQHPLQLHSALLIHFTFRLPTRPLQHRDRLPPVPCSQLQHRLIVLHVCKNVVYPYTKPLHLGNVQFTLIWQRVRALTVYLHDIDAVGIGVKEAEDERSRTLKPGLVVVHGAQEATGG